MLEELVAYLEGHLDILDAVSISLKAKNVIQVLCGKEKVPELKKLYLSFVDKAATWEEIVQFLHRVALKLNWGTVCILGQINIS